MAIAPNVIREVSFVAKAKPAAMPPKSAQVPGFILLLPSSWTMYPVAAQNIIDVKLASSIS